MAAGFLPVALARDYRHIDADKRANVAIGFAIGSHDLDDLPARADTDRDLAHTRILLAHIGVDLREQLDLGLEARSIQRIVVDIKPHIGVRGCGGERAVIAAAHRVNRVGRTDQRRYRNVGGVGVADRVTLHRAQAKALRGVVGRLLQPRIVEHQHLGLAIFQEHLAVVCASETSRDFAANDVAIKAGAVEQ